MGDADLANNIEMEMPVPLFVPSCGVIVQRSSADRKKLRSRSFLDNVNAVIIE